MDKKRIKRIIFLKSWEVTQIQTTPKLYQHSLFQIYLLGYNEMINIIVGVETPTYQLRLKFTLIFIIYE